MTSRNVVHGKSSNNIELQIQFANVSGSGSGGGGGGGRENCRRANSQTRLKLNDGSISSGSASDTCSTLPAEPVKTVACLFALVVVLACNLFFAGMIHDRTPTVLNKESMLMEPTLQHPLRDVSLDASRQLRVDPHLKHTILTISEMLAMGTTAFVVVVLCFHEHRSIVLRRFFFLATLLFAVRLISMNVTMLPVSSETLFSRERCYAKSAHFDGGVLARRFLELLSSFGLANASYCGNYVYSGYTVVFVLNCLVLAEYCPSWILNLPLRVLSVCGIALILVCEYDYTISIIVAYYITTRLFWVYHTLAHNASLKNVQGGAFDVNQICKEWWYPIFRFLEGNVRSVVPAMRYSFLR